MYCTACMMGLGLYSLSNFNSPLKPEKKFINYIEIEVYALHKSLLI